MELNLNGFLTLFESNIVIKFDQNKYKMLNIQATPFPFNVIPLFFWICTLLFPIKGQHPTFCIFIQPNPTVSLRFPLQYLLSMKHSSTQATHADRCHPGGRQDKEIKTQLILQVLLFPHIGTRLIPIPIGDSPDVGR